MNWERYTCQLNLPGFGKQAQQMLQNASVLIVGAGGLGCPVAQYLTGAGVGRIGIADPDVVSISNLHRQILFGPADFGKNKAEVVCERLKLQNPDIELTPHSVRIDNGNVLDIFGDYDVVLDCSDNFDTRYLVNDGAVLSDKPIVYGAIYRFEGQVAVFNIELPNGQRSPNYRDIFPKVNSPMIPDCSEGGVIPTLAGIIGCMMANEAIKLLTQTGEVLAARLLLFDAQTMQSKVIKTIPVTQTEIFALPQPAPAAHTINRNELDEQIQNNTVELVDVRSAAERNAFNIGGRHIPLDELESRLDSLPTDKPTVFYCATGKRSAEAAKLVSLKLPGTMALSLNGGIQEWMDING